MISKAGYHALSKEGQERYVCNFVRLQWESHTRQTQDDRNRWMLAQNLFRGKMDWGEYREKYPWRAKIFVHLFSSLVRRMADMSQDLVFQRPDWFRMTATNEADEEFARIREKIVRYYATDKLDVPNFAYEYFLNGGIYGVAIWKLVGEQRSYWVPSFVIEEVEKQENRDNKRSSKRGQKKVPQLVDNRSVIENELSAAIGDIFEDAPVEARRVVRPKKEFEFCPTLHCVNPLNFAYQTDCDDLNSSPYTIEKMWKKIFELEDYFNSGFFDKDKRDILKKGADLHGGSGALNDSYMEQKLSHRDQIDDTNKYGPVVELLEYYGDLRSEDGDVIEEAVHAVVGNGNVLLRKARITNWAQSHPYGATIFSKVPGKAIGAGVADNAIDQQLALNELFSLFYDLCNLATLGVSTCDISSLDDPSQIDNGYFPGQIIAASKPARDVFDKLNFDTAIAPQMFQMFQMLQQTGLQGTAVDVTPANPSSRARITAQEIQSNSNRATQSQFALGREIDSHFVQPLIRAIDAYCMQFAFTEAALSDMYAKDVLTKDEYELVTGLTPEERLNELKRHVKIEVKGFRDRLERDDLFKRMNEAASVIGRDPSIPQYINMGEFWKNYMALLFPSELEEKFVLRNTPQDKAREENYILANNQMISVLPNDTHSAEILVHYGELAKNPGNQALFAHVVAHIQQMMAQGQVPPTPPKELEPLFQQYFQAMGPQLNGMMPGGPTLQ